MDISTDTVKELRDKTGVSVMQCRKALQEAGGDLGKAIVILRKHSSGAAEKKAERALGAGAIGSYVHEGVIGAMALLSSETDFVAKNPEFIALAREIAMQVAATDPKYLSVAEIPSEARDAAVAVFEKELEGLPPASAGWAQAGKSAEMKEKIMEGKLASYFRDQVLLAQPYIKDESKTIQDLVNEATQKFGERIEITRFARLSARA